MVDENSSNIDPASENGKEEEDSVTSAESINTATATSTEAEVSSSSSNTKKFHVVGGAFREVANANKKLEQLKAKGYDAQIVGKNKWQLTQVAFGSYTTKEEAQTALNDIRKTIAKDAWLLVK